MTNAVLLGLLLKITIFFTFAAGSLILVVDLIYPTWIRIRDSVFGYVDQYLPLSDAIEFVKKVYYSSSTDNAESPSSESDEKGEEEKTENEDCNGDVKAGKESEVAADGAVDDSGSDAPSRSVPLVLYYFALLLLSALIARYHFVSQPILVLAIVVCIYTFVFGQGLSEHNLQHTCVLASCLITCFGVLYAAQITAVQLVILGVCVFVVERYTSEKPSAIPNWRRVVLTMMLYYAIWFFARKWLWHFVLSSIVLFVIMDRFRWGNIYNVTFWFIYSVFCTAVVKAPSMALITLVLVGLRAASKIIAADNSVHDHFDKLIEYTNWVFSVPDWNFLELMIIGKDTLVNSVKGAEPEETEGEDVDEQVGDSGEGERSEEGQEVNQQNEKDEEAAEGNEEEEEEEEEEEAGEKQEETQVKRQFKEQVGVEEEERAVEEQECDERSEQEVKQTVKADNKKQVAQAKEAEIKKVIASRVDAEAEVMETDHRSQYRVREAHPTAQTSASVHPPFISPPPTPTVLKQPSKITHSSRTLSSSSALSPKSVTGTKDKNPSLDFAEEADNHKIGEIERELELKLDRIKQLENEVENRLTRIMKLEKLNRVQTLETECEQKLERIIKIEADLEKRISRSNSQETQCEMDMLDENDDYNPRKKLITKPAESSSSKVEHLPAALPAASETLTVEDNGTIEQAEVSEETTQNKADIEEQSTADDGHTEIVNESESEVTSTLIDTTSAFNIDIADEQQEWRQMKKEEIVREMQKEQQEEEEEEEEVEDVEIEEDET